MIPLFLVGVLSVVCQVVLLRELNVAFYGVELVYLLGFSTWMAGSAAGAALALRPARASSPWTIRWVLMVAAGTLPCAVALVRGHRWLFGAVPGAFLPFDRQVLLLVWVLVPHAALLGLGFRRAAESCHTRGRRTSRWRLEQRDLRRWHSWSRSLATRIRVAGGRLSMSEHRWSRR